MINRKHKGALAEMKATAWLLEQGYEVFRNVSSHGLIDLVAIKDGEFLKLDVKTGTDYAIHPSKTSEQQKQAGVKLLVVTPLGFFIAEPRPARPPATCKQWRLSGC